MGLRSGPLSPQSAAAYAMPAELGWNHVGDSPRPKGVGIFVSSEGVIDMTDDDTGTRLRCNWLIQVRSLFEEEENV
jgi:hypothetical protein